MLIFGGHNKSIFREVWKGENNVAIFFTLVTLTHCLISSIHVLNDLFFFDYTYDVQLKQRYNLQHFNFGPMMVCVCVCVCLFCCSYFQYMLYQYANNLIIIKVCSQFI